MLPPSTMVVVQPPPVVQHNLFDNIAMALDTAKAPTKTPWVARGGESAMYSSKVVQPDAPRSGQHRTPLIGTQSMIPIPGVRDATVSGALSMIDPRTTRLLLQVQTKENLFKGHKFVDQDDLHFSNAQESICRQLARLLQVPEHEVENWWSDQKKDVLKAFHNHRNNVIKSIGKSFQGMNVYAVQCCFMNDRHANQRNSPYYA